MEGDVEGISCQWLSRWFDDRKERKSKNATGAKGCCGKRAAKQTKVQRAAETSAMREYLCLLSLFLVV